MGHKREQSTTCWVVSVVVLSGLQTALCGCGMRPVAGAVLACWGGAVHVAARTPCTHSVLHAPPTTAHPRPAPPSLLNEKNKNQKKNDHWSRYNPIHNSNTSFMTEHSWICSVKCNHRGGSMDTTNNDGPYS